MSLVRENIEFRRGQDSKKGLGVGEYQVRTAPFDWYSIPDGNYIATDTIDGQGHHQHCLIKIRIAVGDSIIRQITYWVPTDIRVDKSIIPNKIAKFSEDWYADNDFNFLQKTDDYSELFESVEFRRSRNSKSSLNIGEYRKWEQPIDWDSIPDGNYEIINSQENFYEASWIKIFKEDGMTMVKEISDWTQNDPAKNLRKEIIIKPLKEWAIHIFITSIQKTNKHPELFESMNFKRGIKSKEAIGVGIKETNRDLETLAQNFEEHFNKYTFLGHNITRRESRGRGSGTNRFPMYFRMLIDSIDGFEFELDRKRRRFRAWFKKNTPYDLKSIKKGGTFANSKSSSGYQRSYTFYMDDK